jgi:lysine-specific demethylase 8
MLFLNCAWIFSLTDNVHFFVKVVGRKYIRLYEPGECVYPYLGDKMLFNTSQVEVETPDYNKFPLFKNAKYSECILAAGETLYIPPKHWHYVRSLDISFSVSFWWE